MKKLAEMKIAQKAILTEIEASSKGGKPVFSGPNAKDSSYFGPSSPSSITTFWEGMNMGADGAQGGYGGDNWSCSFVLNSQPGQIVIQHI